MSGLLGLSLVAKALAHVRRFDWLVYLVARTVCAIYWFHPFDLGRLAASVCRHGARLR
jgi:hypothetical protein